MDRTRRTVVVLLAVTLALAGCALDDDGASSGGTIDEVVEVEPVAPTDATRDDVDCSPEALGEDDVTSFVSVHVVVDGELGARCLGEEDPTLLRAWAELVAITPPGQLTDLAVFAGFVHPDADELGDEAESTLAFVNTIDDEGTDFQLSVDLDQFDLDEDQARLTLAHEFSHVFTTNATQFDRSEAAFDGCQTYLSSDGCFLPGSLIAAWVEEFWDDGRLDELDPEVEPSLESGAERCAADPSFIGEYAASDPEEDFAETFSAYVFDVEVDTAEVQEKLDWLADQPGLVEFRERAQDAGLTPIPNTFEGCG